MWRRTGSRRLDSLAILAAAAVLGSAFGLLPAVGQEGDNPGFMAASGRVTFRTYCATCHGKEARGDGNIAQYLTTPPADLTRISERNDGVFPTERIVQIVDGREQLRAHGSQDMPVWGDVFQNSMAVQSQAPDETGEERAARKIREIVYFLESIQVGTEEAGDGG